MAKQTDKYMAMVKNLIDCPMTYFTGGTVKRILDHYETIIAEMEVTLGIVERDVKGLETDYLGRIKQLQEEKELLLRTIEDEVGRQKKVVLPREVAEAIEFLREKDISDFSIIALSEITSMLGRDYSQEIINQLKVIHEFRFFNGYSGSDLILKALVNGYTVEEEKPSLEQRIDVGVRTIFKEWITEPFNGKNFRNDQELADRIALFVKREVENEKRSG